MSQRVTRRRSPDFSLVQALDDPGFTPRASDTRDLVGLVTQADDEALARRAGAALHRIEGIAPEVFAAALAHPNSEARRRALRELGRFEDAMHTAALAALAMPGLADPSPAVRRAAARLLGKVADASNVAPITAAAARETDASVRAELRLALARSGVVVETTGGETSATDQKAELIAARHAARAAAVTLDPTRETSAPLAMIVRVRAGLEAIALDELGAAGLRFTSRGPGELQGEARSFARLLTSRIALDVGFVLPLARRDSEEAGVVATLIEAAPILRTFTDGPIRYRLRLADRGKARGAVRSIAIAAAAADPMLVNETAAPDWEIAIEPGGPSGRAIFVPRPEDTRFAYRSAEVPAASHPTVAAALARAARVGAEDVVWDPFVGSGLELCERHLLGGYTRLVGTDIDARAIAAARTNLDAVGAREATLHHVDARTFTPPPVDAVVTNAPLGRRVNRDGALAQVISEVLARAVAALRPGGRVVLTSPHPRTTHDLLRSAGLSLRASSLLDMGGFSVDLAVFEKPGAPKKRRIVG